ncbi:hypothetical protein PR202_ga06547 [Eleusine coracana subsp. coracana]|uniref:Pentatricopeptide repeat-containing protein n=1 Tax=Eleusine coracana subsp. coracana TaxID=191504 RepID=A0AAV5BV71_ELECO|nr:hypothetical protein PR202_ga06547 [Eleusine coracana subsp. coracana]
MAPPPLPSGLLPSWAASNDLFRRHRRLVPLLPAHLPPRPPPDPFPRIVSGLARNPFVASCLPRRLLPCLPPLHPPPPLQSPTSSLSPFSFNSVIRASPPRLALGLFDQMRRRGVPPDPYTLPFLIHACSGSDPPLCQSLQGHAFRLGYGSHLFTQTALINMYFACGSVAAARRVFDEMQTRDVVAWTGMVSGYVDSQMYLQSVEVFREMRRADDLVRPNVATVVSVASACAGLGSLECAKGLHAYVEKGGFGERADCQ